MKHVFKTASILFIIWGMPFCSQAQLIVINPKYVSGILVDNEASTIFWLKYLKN